nr:hypothetical protein [Tanacetum cinerariifolium]
MSNTNNNNMQTQTSNALYNAIIEAGGKDRPSMLAPVDACPNTIEIWKAIERLKQGESINVQDLETNLYWELGKFTSRDGESLDSYYSRFYKMMNELVKNSCKVTNHQVIVQFLLQLQPKWQRGKTIINSPPPTYDQEPDIVVEYDAFSKEKEIDKLISLISLSFKKIYKPTNNNLRTLSNTSRANQDNNLRTNRGTGYDNQREVNDGGARENVETKTGKGFSLSQREDAIMLLCNQEEAVIQQHPEQPEYVNDTYLGEQCDTKITTASLDISTNGEEANQDDDDLVIERDLLAFLIKKLKCEIDDNKNRNKLLESSNKTLVDKLKSKIEDSKTKINV